MLFVDITILKIMGFQQMPTTLVPLQEDAKEMDKPLQE